MNQLEDDGQRWLRENRHRIELYRLPAYSPEFMAMEGVWKTTRKLTLCPQVLSIVGIQDSACAVNGKSIAVYLCRRIAGMEPSDNAIEPCKCVQISVRVECRVVVMVG